MNAKEFNRLLKLLGKNKKSMDSLFAYYFKRIVFHLQAIYGLTVAEDAAQTFFKSLLVKVSTLPYIKYPTSWVYTCSENIAKRIIEKDSRTIVPIIDENNNTVSKEELYGDLYREIKKLDTLDQDIIFKHYWEGYSFEEIALMYNCKSGTIRQRFHRASKKLNHTLKGLRK